MKRIILFFFLFSIWASFPQVNDSSFNKNKSIPTIKIIQENPIGFFNYDFARILISVLLGSGLTLFGVYLQNKYQKKIMDKQISNQRNISQAQIIVANKEKWIDGIREIHKNIAKNLF